jgi:hypothetical protein
MPVRRRGSNVVHPPHRRRSGERGEPAARPRNRRRAVPPQPQARHPRRPALLAEFTDGGGSLVLGVTYNTSACRAVLGGALIAARVTLAQLRFLVGADDEPSRAWRGSAAAVLADTGRWVKAQVDAMPDHDV